MKCITTIGLVVFCLLGFRAVGSERAARIRAALSAVAAAELPTTAAQLVKEAPSKQRVDTTVEVVKTALRLNPAAVAPLIGAIARVSPEMAATAAGCAATE